MRKDRKKNLLKIIGSHLESGVMVVNLKGIENSEKTIYQLREDLSNLGYSSRDLVDRDSPEIHHILYCKGRAIIQFVNGGVRHA